MSSWDNTPAVAWTDTPAKAWDQDSKANTMNGDNHFSEKSHGHDLNNADAGDDNCRNCHQPGHFARNCPEERKTSSECFNCGETGHNKADCPNPKVERAFTGICRLCEGEGHRAADCPQKAPEKCHNCLKEGHKASECQENRVFDQTKVPDMDKAAAWKLMKQAVEEKEVVEFLEALKIYIKGDADITYPQLEKKFRDAGLGIYLIALDKEIPQTMTNVNLQGKCGCKYTVGYYFKPKPTRPILQAFWPATPAENLERLEDAGQTLENNVPLCRNCKELGHMSKECTQEKVEPTDAVGIVCGNCSETGHRLRDCPKERAPRGGTCRNCNQPGHKAADCTEERSAANVECRRCNEMGHFSKDCPNKEGGGGGSGCRNCGEEGHFAKECDKPKNPANMICRNCDQAGHGAKDCPEPRDWSRVKCNNCGELGHTIKRCKQPLPEADNSFEVEDLSGAGGYSGGGAEAAGADNWATKADTTWDNTVTVGGW